MENPFNFRLFLLGALVAPILCCSVAAAECSWQRGRDLSIWSVPSLVEEISKGQAKEDLDCFSKALKASYSAINDQNEKLGIQKLEMISNSLPDTVRTEELGKRIFEAVSSLTTDLHFQIRLGKDRSVRSTAKNISVAQMPPSGVSADWICQGAQLRKVWIQDQLEVRWVLRHEKPISQLSCLNLKTKMPHLLSLTTVKSLKADFNPEEAKLTKYGQVVYFRPGSLMGNADPQVAAEQKKFVEMLKNEDSPLILDLRGNRGGGGTFAQDLAQMLSTPDQKIPSSKSVSRKGVFPELGFINTLFFLEYPDALQNRSKFEDHFGSALIRENLVRQNWDPEIQRYKGQRSKRYQSPVMALIDSDCASECETVVELLKWHPNVQFLGAPTAGALHFSNAAGFLLPNSSMMVFIPTLRNYYEADAKEGEGYEPNYYYFGSDPVGQSLRLLENL